MALFPQTFLDDLHLHADIVQVIGDVVSLKRSGATWKGLCPFHGEKTPSFHVEPREGLLPLLRLRRRRRRDQVRRAAREGQLPGSRPHAGGQVRPDGARGARDGVERHQPRRSARRCSRCTRSRPRGSARSFDPPQAPGCASSSPREHQRADDRGPRHRLRAAGARRAEGTSHRARLRLPMLLRAGLVVQRTRAKSSIGSATG